MLKEQSRTETLLQLRRDQVPRGVANTHPIFAARAQGAQLWDIDGNEYIDFVGGIGVLNVGHSHPKVVQAVQAQLERLTHSCFQVAMYESYVRLAERLNALVPGAEAKKTILLTTGAEAVENAIKIARAATKRPAVIAFTHSFHGRTLMGMSLTGKATAYKQNFGPFAPEVYHAPYPYDYRGWNSERALAAFREMLLTEVTPEQIAAVIIEPVLGEGGFVPAPAEFLRELRRITQEHGILLIADEVQTGFGRTGKMFAIEHSGVEPDMVVLAKSLAGGLPLSAVVGRAEIMDAPEPGGLGGTYAGNPLACAAGLAVLDVFEQENLLGRAQQLAERFSSQCQALQQEVAEIGDVRGLGMMLALEFVRDRESKEPAPELVDQVVKQAREQGLLLLKAGLYGNVVRILVPLVVEEPLISRSLEILRTVVKGVVQQK
ncbi:4-aminobutyrate--2-oxoglutarate transaminase [Ktedonobacter racemifer]|uniref:(S)-3-amino-2-methylpropionate transaminase n=1 Tax=Ktedonobacter racemifer DSM 44963 TaxID=485913 RepID=D6U015_KTERA|nr:4-aminobutyrate--2-oxoglutarate transaminase [Ktedonobacter racemifer]EFH82155.1 4-aminobutyrate aminotransferase [Ktedonobacter racemifer DSM 44963]